HARAPPEKSPAEGNSRTTRSGPAPDRAFLRAGADPPHLCSDRPHAGGTPPFQRSETMAIKINKKITGYNVVKPEDKAVAAPVAPAAPKAAPTAEVIQMHESVQRPESLVGSTFKIKSPLFEHALYVTINDIVLN